MAILFRFRLAVSYRSQPTGEAISGKLFFFIDDGVDSLVATLEMGNSPLEDLASAAESTRIDRQSQVRSTKGEAERIQFVIQLR
jgi:hypothetical protein